MISKAQIVAYKAIKEAFPNAVLEYEVKVKDRTFFADIALIEEKIIVEYDEPYFHRQKSKDIWRRGLLRRAGWKVISIEKLKEIQSAISKIHETKIENNKAD